jgi:hypothetical protein
MSPRFKRGYLSGKHTIATEEAHAVQNAHKEIHYFCTADFSIRVEHLYKDTSRESRSCKPLGEPSNVLGLISTGRYFVGVVCLLTYPDRERCDGGTLYRVEYVWAKK